MSLKISPWMKKFIPKEMMSFIEITETINSIDFVMFNKSTDLFKAVWTKSTMKGVGGLG